MHAAQYPPEHQSFRFCSAGLEAEKRRHVQISGANLAVRRELSHLRPGRWRKVIKQGNLGEVHYFEHEFGRVAGVKFFSMRGSQ